MGAVNSLIKINMRRLAGPRGGASFGIGLRLRDGAGNSQSGSTAAHSGLLS